MQPNRFVLLAGAVILVTGVISASQKNQPLSTPVEASIVFVLLLSLLDALGPGPSKLAGAFALLAMVAVLVKDGPPILQSLPSWTGQKEAAHV